LFVILPSPYPGALAHPFTPEVPRTKERIPNSSFFCCVHLGFTFESIKDFGSASKGHSREVVDQVKSLVEGEVFYTMGATVSTITLVANKMFFFQAFAE
jgi:hypothetical protein